jgi:hypothetical protein
MVAEVSTYQDFSLTPGAMLTSSYGEIFGMRCKALTLEGFDHEQQSVARKTCCCYLNWERFSRSAILRKRTRSYFLSLAMIIGDL